MKWNVERFFLKIKLSFTFVKCIMFDLVFLVSCKTIITQTFHLIDERIVLHCIGVKYTIRLRDQIYVKFLWNSLFDCLSEHDWLLWNILLFHVLLKYLLYLRSERQKVYVELKLFRKANNVTTNIWVRLISCS